MPLSYLGGVTKFYLISPTAAVPVVAAPVGVTIRRIEVDPLGLESEQARVLRDAYAVSPDIQTDADDREDAVLFWRGEWGPPVGAASLGAFADDRLIGLSYVCERSDAPLLADLVVEPGWHGRGVGAALISASAAALSAEGFAVFTLAVHADNVAALGLYARMGFRLYAEGCVEGDSVAYRTEGQFRVVNAQFEKVVPSMSLDVRYAVAPIPTPTGFVQFVNTVAEHRLPGRILATLVGHRSGSGRYPMDRRGLEVAVALLSPAEVASIYEHPNLGSWRRALETGAERFEVCFGDVLDDGWPSE